MFVVEGLDLFQDVFLFVEGLCVSELLDGYFKWFSCLRDLVYRERGGGKAYLL